TEFYDRRQVWDAFRVDADLLISLRWDAHIEDLLKPTDLEARSHGLAADQTHVTVEHRWVVFPYTGWYDLLDSYTYAGAPPAEGRPREVRAVGLCISAGFHLNASPVS